MKINIEFNLTDDEDKHRFDEFLAAPKVSSIVEELCTLVRSTYKHGDVPESMQDFVSEVYQLVCEARYAGEQ